MIRVLIVDDEQIIVDALYYYILRKQCEELDVYRSYASLEALSLLEQASFDILLADISMPDMDGLELMEKARSLWPEIRVIYFTGFDSFDYAYRALKYEGVSYILKTDGYDQIWERIQKEMELLRTRHSMRMQAMVYRQALNSLDTNDFWQRVLQNAMNDTDLRKDNPMLARWDWQRPSFSLYGNLSPYSPDLRMAVDEAIGRFLAQDFVCCYSISNTVLYALLQFCAPQTREKSFSHIYFEAMLEKIQQNMAEARGIAASFVYGESVLQPQDLPGVFSSLQSTMERCGGQGDLLLMAYREQDYSRQWAIRRIQQYVAENIDQELSLLKLADTVHFNPSYLSRFYHQQTGERLQDFINRVRLENAAALLDGSPLPIKDIAQRCGYGSSKYFSKLFRQQYGLAPVEWRKRNRR